MFLNLDKIEIRKALLLIAIILTSSVVLIAPEYGDINSNWLNYLVVFGKTAALIGTVMLFWQHLTGIRVLMGKFIPDLDFVLDIHKKLGKYGVLLFIAHILFIAAHRWLAYEVNLFKIAFETNREIGLSYGWIAFIIIIIIVTSSLYFKNQVGFSWWKSIHNLGYFIFPLIILHAFALGSATNSVGWLSTFWLVLTIIYVFTLIINILKALGLFKTKYKIVKINSLTKDTKEFVMETEETPIVPALGQYVFLQLGLGYETHPYTVSDFDEKTGRISVSVKILGDGSELLHKVKVGREVYLEGPYGIFTQSALQENNKPLVLIAGGIGITPFRRIWEKHSKGEINRNIYLFYGNNTVAEIAFKEELERIKNKENNKDQTDTFEVIDVIAFQDDYKGEKGFITKEVLQKHLPWDLTKYEFLICGPPVMIEKLSSALKKSGVSKYQINFEKFNW